MGFHILLSLLFYNVLLLIVWNHYKKDHYYIKKSNLFILTLLLVAFGTYGGGEGDFWKYKDMVEATHTLFDVTFSNGMEMQYYYLAYLLDGNYYLWRLVLFSIQFLGLSWFLNKAKLNTYPIILCFISFCLVSSIYGRSFWGAVFYFMGVYLLLEKKNPLFLIAIALSYVSHTQNIVLFAMLPLAFIDIKKWHILLFILLFGTLASLLSDTFTSILDTGGIEGADYMNDRMESYRDSELGAFGNSIGEYIITVLRYVPMALVFITWFGLIFLKRDVYLSYYKPYRRVLNISIGLLLASVVVLFASLGGGTFFYRILGMVSFPLIILIPYMVETKTIKRKTFNMYIFIFAITTELNYLKDIYYALANGNF